MKDLAVTILLCSSEDEEDRSMVDRLKAHLSPLVYEKRIALWDHSNIIPGTEREKEMDKHLEEDQIILLLISASFLASQYNVVQRAMVRYERSKEVRVIHVILRDVMWEITLLKGLQPLPDDSASIADWANRGKGWEDKAYKNVAVGIFKVVEEIKAFSLLNKRRALNLTLDQLIETVRLQVEPPPRAEALIYTLQQSRMIIPDDVTLADLVIGWQTLSFASKRGDDTPTTQRRVTCGELANIASQITGGEGNVAQAIKTWSIWAEAFKKSDDPRQTAMAKTFARELKELQEAMH